MGHSVKRRRIFISVPDHIGFLDVLNFVPTLRLDQGVKNNEAKHVDKCNSYCMFLATLVLIKIHGETKKLIIFFQSLNIKSTYYQSIWTYKMSLEYKPFSRMSRCLMS